VRGGVWELRRSLLRVGCSEEDACRMRADLCEGTVTGTSELTSNSRVYELNSQTDA
jgi:hypothetical protein